MTVPPVVPDVEANAIAQRVIEGLRSLRFGSIELTVHDGRVVQFERREKVRLDASERCNPQR